MSNRTGVSPAFVIMAVVWTARPTTVAGNTRLLGSKVSRGRKVSVLGEKVWPETVRVRHQGGVMVAVSTWL